MNEKGSAVWNVKVEGSVRVMYCMLGLGRGKSEVRRWKGLSGAAQKWQPTSGAVKKRQNGQKWNKAVPNAVSKGRDVSTSIATVLPAHVAWLLINSHINYLLQ